MSKVSIVILMADSKDGKETNLVAADLLSNMVQRLDDAQTQLLSLLVLRNSDILDVSNLTQAVDTIVTRISTKVSLDVSLLFLETHNFFSTIKAPVPTILFSPFRMTNVW